MNKKFFIRGTVLALAGFGIYKFISSKQTSNADAIWTTADMPDLTDNVIIVTGANSGIGFEAAREFARRGAQVILACRNMEKAQTASAAIQAEISDAQVTVMQLDLASQASVHQFAEEFNANYDRLDRLVNNAGIMAVPYATTVDGFESQLGTNHLGHFALTGLLIDRLLATPRARVVNISSGGHRMGDMDYDNLMYENGAGYSAIRAYGRSKLANLLFTYELQRRFDAAGADAIAVAAHPGGSDTNLGNHLEGEWYFRALGPVMERMMQSAAMGALPTMRATVEPGVQGAAYYGPNGFMEQRGFPVVVKSSAASHNLADADRLWQVSEELTGIYYLD